jgi:hypothetical protein
MHVPRDACKLSDRHWMSVIWRIWDSTGTFFTWRRGKIRERLDWAVRNSNWSLMFPLAGVVNEDFGKSDHRPMLINT